MTTATGYHRAVQKPTKRTASAAATITAAALTAGLVGWFLAADNAENQRIHDEAAATWSPSPNFAAYTPKPN